jgi:hypothetical protein
MPGPEYDPTYGGCYVCPLNFQVICPTSRHREQMALLTLQQGPEPNFDEADEHTLNG